MGVARDELKVLAWLCTGGNGDTDMREQKHKWVKTIMLANLGHVKGTLTRDLAPSLQPRTLHPEPESLSTQLSTPNPTA